MPCSQQHPENKKGIKISIKIYFDVNAIINEGLNNCSNFAFKLVTISGSVRSCIYISFSCSFRQYTTNRYTSRNVRTWFQHSFDVFWISTSHSNLFACYSVSNGCWNKALWNENIQCKGLHVSYRTLLERYMLVWILGLFLFFKCIRPAVVIIQEILYSKKASGCKIWLSKSWKESIIIIIIIIHQPWKKLYSRIPKM